MTAAEIVEQADCLGESVRTHLSFYADLGIGIHHEGRPVRYEHNDDYFEWQHMNELAQEHTIEELQTRVSELTDTIETYRDEYGVDFPAEVDVLGFDTEMGDGVYVNPSDWAPSHCAFRVCTSRRRSRKPLPQGASVSWRVGRGSSHRCAVLPTSAGMVALPTI